MKKALSLIVALCLTGTLAACGSAPADSSGSSPNAGTPAKVDLSGEVTGQINVSCYDTMLYKDTLEAAAAQFEAKHPGVEVNIETFSAMPDVKTMEQDGMSVMVMENADDPQSRADYLNKINTALMSGGGPDLLAMDILPISRYAENGQLEALDAYMESDPGFRTEDYRQNILDAVKYEDNTWFLPTNYSFDYLAFDSSLLSTDQADALKNADTFTYQGLIEGSAKAFAAANTDADNPAPLFNMGDSEELFQRLLEENYSRFVDPAAKTANFADGNFAALLESAKAYADKGYLAANTPKMDLSSDMDLSNFIVQDDSRQFFYKPQYYMSLMQDLDKSDSGNVMAFGTGAGGNRDNDVLGGVHANADGETPLRFDQGYAMNANSGNKRTAWEFLKFLLSEEVQLSPTAFGLPVNNTARAKTAEMTIDGSLFGTEFPMDEARKQLLADYTAAVERYSDQINYYPVKDSAIDDMISGETAYFFDGSKTAGDVAQALQSRVNLYLGE